MVISPVRAVRPTLSSQFPVGTGWQPLSLPVAPLFGTDGIRGKAGDILTAPLAVQIGFWAAQVLTQGRSKPAPIIIGQDSRNSSDMLASALAAGLTAAGVDVWNLGLSPTAAVSYLASCPETAGGIMISASHNPPEDNGIKFFGPDGAKLASQLQKRIELALRSGTLADMSSAEVNASQGAWGKTYQTPDLIERYVDFLHQPFQPQPDLSGMRIVLDLAWGAATSVAERVFEATGAEVFVIHGMPDGDRINVNCGSTNLSSLKAAVSEHQADIGFAFDGDADRVMAVDSKGRVVDGDYILYFWGRTLQRGNRLPENTIVSTVMANLGFERAWNHLGGQLVRTPVGDQHVHAEMVQRGAMLGGEQSGHILCHHYSVTGDGILTALHLADLIKQAGSSLPALIDDSFNPYPQKLQNVRVEDRDRRLNWSDCEPLQQAIDHAAAAMGDQGRILVRASGTEPVIRVMVEAASPDLVEHWTGQLVGVVTHQLAA
ncbi:MAG: phosphoglucosamine mutase [Cyanobacteria bacterium P01_A01_bin.114]